MAGKETARVRGGVKFCGGCNPEYDWLAFWERVKALSVGRIEWVRWDDDGKECLLLLSGCETSCAEKELERKNVPARVFSVNGNGTDSGDVVMYFLAGGGRKSCGESEG